MSAVWTAEDRSLRVKPHQAVNTAWVSIDRCVLGNRTRLAIGDVEKAYRKLLCLGDDAPWPPLVGEWRDRGQQFVVLDGRHEFAAALLLGRERVFVGWLVDASEPPQP